MGRPKGALNKTTALLKDAILQAAEEAGQVEGGKPGEGLKDYLKARAIDTPGPFMALLGKILPNEMANAENADGEREPLRVIFVDNG